MARRRAAIVIIGVVALYFNGCSFIVSPQKRGEWRERLAAAEKNLKNERLDIEAAGKAATSNQLGFIDDIVYLRKLRIDPPLSMNEEQIEADAIDCRNQVLLWSKSQQDACEKIKDIEQDMALLRDDMEEGGF